MDNLDLDKAHREQIRWRILKVLDAGRPTDVSESVILQVMHDSALPITPHGLRRELDYLEERKLIRVRGNNGPTWSAELTHLGIDVVEYTIDCHAGIGRPRKWF